MADTEQPDPAKVEEFIELLTRHDNMLTGYVMSLVASAADAQDILQETKMALWRSMASFESGTNFGAWSRKTALYRVMAYRKKKGRENQRLWFSDECYEMLAEDYEAEPENFAEQSQQLKTCIAKLQPAHREILVLRYFRESSVEDVAARVERTVDATYRVLSRIRLALRKCMTAQHSKP
jgi:RNA polymerase sigma-70 factor, ECF subfamily